MLVQEKPTSALGRRCDGSGDSSGTSSPGGSAKGSSKTYVCLIRMSCNVVRLSGLVLGCCDAKTNTTRTHLIRTTRGISIGTSNLLQHLQTLSYFTKYGGFAIKVLLVGLQSEVELPSQGKTECQPTTQWRCVSTRGWLLPVTRWCPQLHQLGQRPLCQPWCASNWGRFHRQRSASCRHECGCKARVQEVCDGVSQ